jgi:hypothetical protein
MYEALPGNFQCPIDFRWKSEWLDLLDQLLKQFENVLFIIIIVIICTEQNHN